MATQQVIPLADALANLLQTPAGLIAVVVFFLWLLVNKDFSHLFELFERKEKRRSEQLDLYVSKPELADANSIKVLSDLRDAHYFKVATGILLRQALEKDDGVFAQSLSWRVCRMLLVLGPTLSVMGICRCHLVVRRDVRGLVSLRFTKQSP